MDHVTFTVEEKRLDLHINFPKGSRFACPVYGEPCPVHDTRDHIWRHLDFFQHEAYLHARVPRVKCQKHGVHLKDLPLAIHRETAPYSGLLFDMALIDNIGLPKTDLALYADDIELTPVWAGKSCLYHRQG